MKLTISLLIVLCTAATLQGQHAAAPQSQDEKAVQEVLEKIRDLQPPNWSYADLAAKSDLIVIAKAKSSVEVEWRDEIGGDFGKGSTKLLSNRMRILSVLKGQAGDEVNVLTLEWKPDVIVLTNSDFAELKSKLLLPVVVPVVIDGAIVDYGEVVRGDKTYTVEPEYLLYLRHVDGTKYIPVTGQRYSGLSVRRLK
jgi:hypothetical protein